MSQNGETHYKNLAAHHEKKKNKKIKIKKQKRFFSLDGKSCERLSKILIAFLNSYEKNKTP